MRVSVARLAAAAALLQFVFAAPAPANAESVMAACARDWKEAQSAGATGGATWPQYLAHCKTQRSATATPAPAPAAPSQQSGSLFPWLTPSPSTSSPAPPPPPAPAASQQSGSLFPWLNKPSQSAPAPVGAGQFSTEAEARYRCPSDAVVWINTDSKVYHYQGSRYYAHTKQGAYMCEADAKASGARASRWRQTGKNPG